jgi:hypothetical protein
MEDIGDILFYIIAAVIGLVTTLGRKKKPAGAPAPAEYKEAGDIDYPDEEQEYDIDDEPFTEQERVISYEPTYQYSFDPENEGDFIEPIADKLESVKKSQISEKEDIAEKEVSDKIGEEEDLLSDFDLRKAVIYSEILKRNDY